MISKKYEDDYRTERVVEEDGRIVKKAVYIGPYYMFAASRKDVALTKKLCLPVCVLLWVLFVVCFVQDGAAPRQLWVSALYLCSIIPLVYITWSCISMTMARAPFNRETGDDLSLRYHKMTAAFAILTGAAALGGVGVCLFTGTFELPGDLVYLLGNAASAGMGLLLFSRRKSFETTEVSRYSEVFAELMAEKEAKSKK